MTKLNVFVTGQTGYIGGTTLHHLLKNPVAQERFVYRSLVRSEANAKEIQAMGITPVIGSLDDSSLLTNEAAKADLVLHFARADHVPAIVAITKGLQQQGHRHLARPILIHTSGIGIVFDNANGAFASDEIYSDDDPAKVMALPDTALHRNVELVALDPKLHEHVDVYIVSPPVVWGTGTGPVNRHSILVTRLIKNALLHRKVYRIGKGLNRVSRIHVEDLADFYVRLATLSIQQPNILPKGREGYYFVENGEMVYGDVATIIADELYKHGITQDANVYETPNNNEDGYWDPQSFFILGANARTRAVLGGKYLGWKAKHGLGSHEFEQHVREEVQRLIASEKTTAKNHTETR
ncbi:hypothetical protein DFQ26_001348 [Actinomortierella ambigua]|nr:hypothetical protein DFQ26_001348 [Actinomortierella ambigua]